MKQIPLKNRKGDIVDYALVDDEDFNWLSQSTWSRTHRRNTVYAISGQSLGETRYMHRLIALKHQIVTTDLVDHEDRNGLNNQKSNLRPATHSMNAGNAVKPKGTSNESRYKGVRHVKERPGVWEAYIGNGKNSTTYIGRFKNQEDAAIAYDIYAKRLFGEYALLNFPNASQCEIDRINSALNGIKSVGNHTSQYLGVSFDPKRQKWCAFCSISRPNKRSINVGRFDTEEEAARARDKKTLELGLKTRLNFPI